MTGLPEQLNRGSSGCMDSDFLALFGFSHSFGLYSGSRWTGVRTDDALIGRLACQDIKIGPYAMATAGSQWRGRESNYWECIFS